MERDGSIVAAAVRVLWVHMIRVKALQVTEDGNMQGRNDSIT